MVADGKKYASPQATGGAGNSFEHRVQAYYLLLLINGHPTGLGLGPLVQIQFQGQTSGLATDDIICTHQLGDTRTRVYMQCKITLHARASDSAFCKALTGAWGDFAGGSDGDGGSFTRGVDRLVVVCDPATSSESMKDAAHVTELARASVGAQDFAHKCTYKKTSKMLDTIRTVVMPQAQGGEEEATQLWAFLKSLWFYRHDLNAEGSVENSAIMAMIAGHFGAEPSPTFIWARLVLLATQLNRNGATVDRQTILEHLGPELATRTEPDPGRVNVRAASPFLLPSSAGLPGIARFPFNSPLQAFEKIPELQGFDFHGVTAEPVSALLALRGLRVRAYFEEDRISASRVFQDALRRSLWALDSMAGSFDDKACLALFVLLNADNPQLQYQAVLWARGYRISDLKASNEVVESLEKIDFYFNRGVFGREWRLQDAERTRVIRSGVRELRTLDITRELQAKSFRAMTGQPEPPECEDPQELDRFWSMRWNAFDLGYDYRHPEHHTASQAGIAGVVTFEALMRVVQGGCVSEALGHYELCTSELTFDRLLSARVDLAAHVTRGMQRLSGNDSLVLAELDKLLEASLAGAEAGLSRGRLTVLPVPREFRLLADEVFDLDFENISLLPAFEEQARAAHGATRSEQLEFVAESVRHRPPYTAPYTLMGSGSLYADLILARMLRSKLFANSRSEGEAANMHGLGVEQLRITKVFD